MTSMKDVRTLNVWERGNRLTLAVYKATAKFPRDELYGLTSQIRRSCVSVPVNIAEGCGRGSDADLARFLQMAVGLASELEYQSLLAGELGLFEDADREYLIEEITEVKRMLASFIKKLKAEG
jgi:four helix bundle protein